MSAINLHSSRQQRRHAGIFAALGDSTRLSIVTKLSVGEAQSISQLSKKSKLTRQAVTKHLRVLEGAGVVGSARRGRERLFALEAEPLNEIRDYLDLVSRQWDESLLRLKTFVER